jgi:arylformamidase
MKWHDISVDVKPDLPVWPGDPHVVLERFQKLEDGGNANVSRLAMSLHTGTHVDAPFHFLLDGERLSEIALDRFFGRVTVVEIAPEVDVITASVLDMIPNTLITERILFKTRNSTYWKDESTVFHRDFVALDVSGAEFLVGNGVRLVGIDYLSIAPFRDGKGTHEKLLAGDIVILEGLDLSDVGQGSYELFCLPLKLWMTEGAPARAILIER